MPKLPSSSETVRDQGLGVVGATNNTFVVTGTTAAAVKGELNFYTDLQSLVADHVSGPAVTEAAHMLLTAGGPVGVISSATSIAASATAVVAPSGSPPLITVAGDSTVDVTAKLNITKGGDVGEAEFQFSLDDGRTYTPARLVPAGGSYVLPNAMTLTFPSGTYVDQDEYTFTAEAAASNATDLQATMAVLDASLADWRAVVVSTSLGTGGAEEHSLLAIALNAELVTMATNSKYRAGIINTSSSLEDPIDDFGTLIAGRSCIPHGRAVVFGGVPMEGLAFPVMNASAVIAARCAGSLISTDPKRVPGNGVNDGGPLPRIVELRYDSRTATDGQALDDVKLSSLRTYEGKGGFYITQANIKSADGSDFTIWPRRIVMDVACETVHDVQTTFIGRGIRTLNGGLIDERDALRFESEVQNRLDAVLKSPRNAEGTGGHVSAVVYTIKRDDNLLADPTIRSNVAIRPLQHADQIEADLGFVATIGEN